MCQILKTTYVVQAQNVSALMLSLVSDIHKGKLERLPLAARAALEDQPNALLRRGECLHTIVKST